MHGDCCVPYFKRQFGKHVSSFGFKDFFSYPVSWETGHAVVKCVCGFFKNVFSLVWLQITFVLDLNELIVTEIVSLM